MIVCHSRRLIVFSFPKTGSETLRAVFAPLAEEPVRPWRQTSRLYPFYPHMSPLEARMLFRRRGWDFDGYRRVTCVRNPYPRLVSLYRMIRQVDGLWHLRARLGLPVPGFRDWLRASRPDGRGGGGRRHQRWRRYGTWSAHAWCHAPDGAPLVTDILRLDHLDSDLPPLMSALGMEPPAVFPVLNRRPGPDWRLWYDADTTALVARRYAWELAKFHSIGPIPLGPVRAA